MSLPGSFSGSGLTAEFKQLPPIVMHGGEVLTGLGITCALVMVCNRWCAEVFYRN